jgi:hypothetical protein
MNDKMVNGVVGGAVVEVDRRESESKGCDVFYPFGLAPPSVDTCVLWCVDRGRHSPDKINVNPDFIKSNYLTACSNKNVKITIVKIYDGEQMVIYHRSCR